MYPTCLLRPEAETSPDSSSSVFMYSVEKKLYVPFKPTTVNSLTTVNSSAEEDPPGRSSATGAPAEQDSTDPTLYFIVALTSGTQALSVGGHQIRWTGATSKRDTANQASRILVDLHRSARDALWSHQARHQDGTYAEFVDTIASQLRSDAEFNCLRVIVGVQITETSRPAPRSDSAAESPALAGQNRALDRESPDTAQELKKTRPEEK